MCNDVTMKLEIESAVTFVASLLRASSLHDPQLDSFSRSLCQLLAERYQQHWFPDKPCKGSAYRCIRINHKMDPLLGQAAICIGLSTEQLFRLLPRELTLWIDPFEVSYRIGEDGSICVLYEATRVTLPPTTPEQCSYTLGCKESREYVLGRTSPSRSYAMMTVSG
uniref:B-cell translocation gene 1, anti-proliferative n=1 Tax=Eptatretus burgeri TaxID=7764 RepID=A0A8C4PYK1_EPTBU